MSAILEVKQQLHTELTDAAATVPALEGVKVGWGKDPNAFEAIVMWNADSERDYGPIGKQPAPLDETYEIALLIDVVATNRTPEQSEARCWEIEAAVEDVIRANRSDRSFRCAPMKVSQEGLQTDKAVGCRIKLTVAGQARI